MGSFSRALYLLFALLVLFTVPLGAKLFCLAFAITLFFLPNYRSRVFGVVLPSAALFGSGALLAAGLLYLASRREEAKPGWLGEWIILLALWAFTLGVLEIWIGGFPLEVITAGSIDVVLRQNLSTLTVHSLNLFRFLLFAALVSVLSVDKEARGEVRSGLFVGVAIAAALSAVQIAELGGCLSLPFQFPNQRGHWNEIRRPTGAFTDPNAFGVFSALAAGYLFSFAGRDRRCLFLGGALLLLGLFSGSRSFLLIVLLTPLIYLMFARAYRAFILIVFGVGALLLGTLTLPVDNWSFLDLATRIIEPIRDGGLSALLQSRLYFWEIGLRMWLDHPILGVGFSRFQDLVPIYAHTYEIPLGAWTDNANNLFLHVLAETGIVGAAALLSGLMRLKQASQRRQGGGKLRNALILSFLVSLFFGPHLFADEVLILSALLLAEQFSPESYKPRWWIWCAVPFVVLASFRAEFGVFSWERSSDQYFRWTKQGSHFYVACTEGDTGATVRNGSPIQISGSYRPRKLASKPQHFSLSPGESKAIQFSCGEYHRWGGVMMHLQLDQDWSPDTPSDRRELGVQLYTDSPRNSYLARQPGTFSFPTAR